MFDILKPDQYYKDIFRVDLKLLQKQGIRGIVCDIDNTIVPWSDEMILEEVLDWFEEVKMMGFKVCLVSNGTDNRVSFFSEKLKLPAVGLAKKPAKKAYRVAMDILNLDPSQIAVIGDQIFTDILGGNRMGFETILVDPMSEKELFITKMMRFLENMVFERKIL